MNISKKKLALFLLIAFFAGGIFFGIGDPEETKIREIVKNEAEWKQLKSIDDEAFLLAGEFILACSAGALAAGNSDLSALETAVIKMQNIIFAA